MSKPLILLVLGTARVGRESEKVVRYFFSKLQNDSRVDVELVDVRDYVVGRTVPSWEENETAQKWRELVAKATAFFFVVPEYNHGYPGEFKMLIDSESKKKYNYKKAVLCAVSDGPFGGARMRENLLPILHQSAITVLVDPLYVMNVDKVFAQSTDEIDKLYAEKLEKILAQLLG